MTGEQYLQLEQYMSACMGDSAHDREHIYRVLANALKIGREEENVDWDVLIAACLLHDVGRPEQFADPKLCHAEIGSEKARAFLLEQGYAPAFAEKVAHCVLTHRFRKARPPQSREARILFDADKLDVTGALGIARTLMYKGDNGHTIYERNPDGTINDGSNLAGDSFFREYKFKLENLYDRFYTEAGSRLAQQRRTIAAAFYRSLLEEVSDTGTAALREILEDGDVQ